MKLLIVINSLATGGAEKLAAESVPLFQEQKIETDILLLNGSNSPLLDDLQTKTSGKIFSLGFGSVYNPMYVFRLMRYLKKYDVVHVHLFPSIYLVALAKMLSFSKVKLVYTEHSTSNRRRSSFFFKIADRIFYSKYSKIITIADEVDEILKSHLNLPETRFEMIPNGIDISKIQHALPYPKSDFFEEDDKILIQVSNFRKPKDQPTLIKALQLLPENFKLILVGDGPTKTACEALAETLQVENRILFTGLRMDVPRLLKTSDVVLLCSHHEGLSLSSLEAMASGKPFVASDVPGLRNIVKGAGIVFEDCNEQNLADEINRLLADENHYNKTVSNCIARANQYDIQKMIAGYIAVYHKILNCKN